VALPIIYVDHSKIREGKLQELRAAVRELAELVESMEPQLLAYYVYLSEDAAQMSVVHLHRNSESLKVHLEVGGPAFARFVDLITLQSIDIYGTPSEELLEELRKKADLLGAGTVRVHPLQAGFDRVRLA
jgi:quinol monooxygenase YgiN